MWSTRRSKNIAADAMRAKVHVSHHEVFRRSGAFAGWPANYGLWAWEDEILTVFAVGRVGPKGDIHELDREHPFKPCQARSLDGGMTWKAEPFHGHVPGGASLSADEHLEIEMKIRPQLDRVRDLALLDDPLDFTDPETIVMCARTGLGRDSVGWFYVSRSRGHHWEGPYAFRGLDLPVAARTDIVPLGCRQALFMLTTAKTDGQEGRVFCARTQDGGLSFQFIGFVGPEPEGYRIMPSSLRLPDGSIVTSTRCADRNKRGSVEIFISSDAGGTWAFAGKAVENTGEGGNPPALVRLEDGGLGLFYGCRADPFGMRMSLSNDDGRSWSGERVLREDGGTPDIGYPKATISGDGTVVVVYYFNDGAGRERYIAASRIRESPSLSLAAPDAKTT
jgi:hypothetical protein